MNAINAAAKVRYIPTSDIAPNPHNPRRLFDKGPMKVLKESILKLGVLVPVTVYEQTSTKKNREQYVLLDGERRWRCAKELNLDSVPAIVIEEPDENTNILTMFHIHNVRESWQLMPTALKLRTLMENLGTRNERSLEELTKLSKAQIRRCKILLSYPRKYQNLMLAPPSARLKADFFIELDRVRRPARRDKLKTWMSYGDSECISILLRKYEDEIISAVTEFRNLSELYRACIEQGKVARFNKELRNLLEEHDYKISDIHIAGATYAVESKEIKRSANRLYAQIANIDLEVIASDKDTIALLKRLTKIIDKKLRNAFLVDVREG